MSTAPLALSADQTVPPVLAGRNVLITGGTTGIGRATAALLVANGANVFIFGRHQPELDEALATLENGRTRTAGITADQADPGDVVRVFTTIEREFGPLDVLVNNAAVPGGPAAAGGEAEWRYRLNADLLGYIDCTRRALTQMRGRKRGHIVNIGSTSAEYASEGSSLYVAAKMAIRGFSRALRSEVAKDGIRVTLIEPGLTGTSFFDEEGEEIADAAVQRREQKKGAMLKAEDVAVAVHYCLTQPERCNVSFLQVEPVAEE